MRQRPPIGPTAWNCHLHPSLRFSCSSNHLIHAFLAVASLWGICVLKNYCIWVRNTASHVCVCFGCQCRPLQTHQQDNSYGGSAIWRVSKFVIPLIVIIIIYSVDSFCATDEQVQYGINVDFNPPTSDIHVKMAESLSRTFHASNIIIVAQLS